MANYNLTGQKIKNTYDQLAQVSGSLLVDGLGSPTTISASNIQNFTTEVSKSAAASGFGAGGGGVSEAVFTAYTSSNDSKVDALIAATSSYLTEVPSGTISSSAQVDLSQASGTAVSASHAITASFALNAGGDTEWDSILNKPSGLVSGSSQVSYNGITDVPSGIVSGAAQLPQIATNTSDIATLTSATSSYLTSLPSGVVSGSSQIDLSQATGTAANATSASYAVTASHALNAGAAFPFTGSAGIQGNLDMNSGGKLTITDWTGSLNATSILIGQTFNDVGRVNTAGDRNVQIGYYSRIVESGTRDNVVVIGADAEAAQDSTAIGKGVICFAADGIALGKDSKVYGNGSIAMAGAEAQGNSNLAIGAGLVTTNTDEINIFGKLKYNSTNSGSFVMEGAVSSPTQTLSAVGGVVAVDAGLSNFFTLAAGGVTATISNPSNVMDGVTYTMRITNGANLSWGTNYNFEGGVAPSLTSGTDIVSFASFGDGQLYCSYLLNLS